MRGPDLRLGEATVERIVRGGRAPERVARSGRLERHREHEGPAHALELARVEPARSRRRR
jgi:hypothetical protein